MKGDLRSIGRPCRADPFRGMLRKAKNSFASEGLHVQIEPLDPMCGITVPCECDSGAVRGNCGSGLLPRKSREWDRSQDLGFGPTAPMRPTEDGKNSPSQGRDGD